MIRFDQWALPDRETHLQKWMTKVGKIVDGRLTYQYHKYELALSHCSTDRRRTALDVGAHVGLWSYWMARDFERVHAFEPVREHADCWQINMANRANAHLHRTALGDKKTVVKMMAGVASTGDSRVSTGPGEPTAGFSYMTTLDRWFDISSDIDFIKLDCEGYESFVIQGGAETIKCCKPVICVEQKPGHGKAFGTSDTAAIELLKKMGYKIAADAGGEDYILIHRG